MSIFTPARRVLYAPAEVAIQVPFIIDRHAGVLPSYATDFAHSAGESEYPELWKGLVGFWPIFLGQTGNVIKDLSGNGFHGVLVGDVRWVPGKFGYAWEGDGTGDYITVANVAGDKLDISTKNFTCGGWFQARAADTLWGKSQPWELRLSGNVPTLGMGDAQTLAATTDVVNTGWHFVIWTIDRAGFARIYVDGIEENNLDISAFSGNDWDTNELFSWCQRSSAVRALDGLFSHGYFWERILPASEIAFLSSNPTALVQLRRRVVMVSVGVALGEDFFRTIEDGMGIADSMGRVQALSRTIIDGVGTADAIGRTQEQVRTLAETLGLTDTLWKAETRIFADAIGIADSVTKTQAFARTIADDIGLIDSESKLMTYVRPLAETLGITDAMSKTVSFPRTISDDVGITDSVTRTAVFARIVAEAMGIEDVVTKTQVQLRTIADTMGLTDAMTPGQLVVFAEAMGITDAMTHTKTQIRVIADSLGITDDLTRIANYVFTQADDVGIGDAMIRVAVALRTISDDVGMTDTMSSISELVKAAWAFMLLKKSN